MAVDIRELGDALERTVAAGLVAQAHALALTRAEDTGPFLNDEVLRRRVRNAQEECGATATHYLNRVLPDVIGTVTAVHAAAGLVKAAYEAGGADNEVRAEFARYGRSAREVADDLGAVADQAGVANAELLGLLEKHDDAEVERIRDEIDKTRADAEAALGDLVTRSKAVGGGVRTFLTDKVKFVTGVVTRFGDDTGDKHDKPTARSGRSTADALTDDKPSTSRSARSRKPFSVESVDIERIKDTGIDDTSAAATGLGDAITSHRRANQRLAGLYQDLYRASASVAVASAVCDQAESFGRSVRAAAKAANELAAAWQHADTAADWSALHTRLTRARASLTGARA